MDNNLVINALEYYDKNSETYKNFISKIKKHKLTNKFSDIDHNIITFYDEENNEIHSSPYELIGIYVSNYRLWSWAWCVPSFWKNSIYISRQILTYGLDLDGGNVDNRFLKTQLTLSRFRITNPTQLDVLVAIASYLSKKPFIYQYKYYPDTDLDVSMNLPEGTLFEKTESDSNDGSNSNYVIYYLFILEPLQGKI